MGVMASSGSGDAARSILQAWAQRIAPHPTDSLADLGVLADELEALRPAADSAVGRVTGRDAGWLRRRLHEIEDWRQNPIAPVMEDRGAASWEERLASLQSDVGKRARMASRALEVADPDNFFGWQSRLLRLHWGKLVVGAVTLACIGAIVCEALSNDSR